ncbi:DISARM system helicase DrmA [Thermogemmatispora sp.]|uniref:DISARM system helicase DrmA n=1 Tax=Thermogemmatispora sp. TaxID=1968838 RepID=UPI0035E45BF7
MTTPDNHKEKEEEAAAAAGEERGRREQPAAGAGSDGGPVAAGAAPPPSPEQLRQQLQQLIINDLLGPAGGPEEEVEDDRVSERYLLGVLAPRGARTQPEQLDDRSPLEESGEEASGQESTLYSPSLCPSSIGLSFTVDGGAEALRVEAAWGHYQRTESQHLPEGARRSRQVWKRQPRRGSTLLPLRIGELGPWAPCDEQPDVLVRGLARRIGQRWLVSLFLVNQQQEPKRLRDSAWLFQPELSVSAPDGSPIFRQSLFESQQPAAGNRSDPEEQQMAMLYRQHLTFAIGHNISVHADILPGDPTRATRLSTSVIPVYEVPPVEAPSPEDLPELGSLLLDMKALAELPPADYRARLLPLVEAYNAWIERQQASLDEPASLLGPHRPAAERALAECRRASERIRAGIELLARDQHVQQAFAFMNEAMWQQRLHSQWAEARRQGRNDPLEAYDRPEGRSWRPFQLAFILLNLPALSDLRHPERSADPQQAIADLLWFPTGGGKTEAYLGLSAYTFAIRRLQGAVGGRDGEHGVAVLMRYTLRLLTLQQFQRAAALVCACELIRRREPERWGQVPFRLGLWVGQRTTPNTTEQSQQAIEHAHRRSSLGSLGGIGSPHQLLACPWCGCPIEPGRDIRTEAVGSGRGRTFIYCGDVAGRCPFCRRHSPEGLPILVVDEEIYRQPPTLLIATVDKFAQLPWRGATQILFGQVRRRCERHGFWGPDLPDHDSHHAIHKGPYAPLPAARTLSHPPLRPPDLIIQDELHLISGPLGSLVALYESLIDRLCTWEIDGRSVRPKVIAATATVRRASEQIHALFLRRAALFPPAGLNVADNFFARQRPEKPGRRYLGICASGRRLKAVLIRVYVACLAAAQYLYERHGASVDPWMTLVGYFNSMNELGGMRRLVEDDVRSRLERMDRRGLARRRPLILEELTSRKSSVDIPNVLDRLERPFLPGPGQASPERRPIDVLLATNMLSVGVDIKRLGLMVVSGQPKTTAEYIQATSRVGRAAPGLVCVVFNWARPRDLSHYEAFEHYHATFYRQVEAISVTPFAARALDRGLTALLVGYLRLLGEEFNANEGAQRVGLPDYRLAFQRYKRAALSDLPARARAVTGDPRCGELVEQMLRQRLEAWTARAREQEGSGSLLGYIDQASEQRVGLLKHAGQGSWNLFSCLDSLRDVEPTVKLILDTNEDQPADEDLPEAGAESLAEGEPPGGGRTDLTNGVSPSLPVEGAPEE